MANKSHTKTKEGILEALRKARKRVNETGYPSEIKRLRVVILEERLRLLEAEMERIDA